MEFNSKHFFNSREGKEDIKKFIGNQLIFKDKLHLYYFDSNFMELEFINNEIQFNEIPKFKNERSKGANIIFNAMQKEAK